MKKITNILDSIRNKYNHTYTTYEISERQALLKNLKQTKEEVNLIMHNIDFITEPILLNQMIFQLKAAQVRYQYWYSMARELEHIPTGAYVSNKIHNLSEQDTISQEQ